MDLKELIKEVEWCIKEGDETALMWMKKVVEAINNSQFGCSSQTDTKLWWKLKELLSLSKPQASPSARSDNSRKIQSAKPKVTILDNNPLSIASYMEDHPDVDL